MNELLELKNIRKYFKLRKSLLKKGKDVVKAVDGVDLTMKRGENLSLVGESGCGKTTLGRIILKLLPMDEGFVMFEGDDISRVSKREMVFFRKRIQMVFQDPYSSLDPRYTVRQIIEEGMIYDKKKRTQKEQRIKELLSMVQMPVNVLDRYPHEFSGGERQRVAIARALALNPKLLILDEAVSSLDVLVQEQIVRLLFELQHKIDITYLFISHNLRIVKKISKKIAVMYSGKIVELASTEEIFNNPLHPYTRALLLAAVEYKATNQDKRIVLRDDSKLVDTGNNHFVRN